MLAEDYARDRISLTRSEEKCHKSYQPHSVRSRLCQISHQSHNVRGRLCQKSHQSHNIRGRLCQKLHQSHNVRGRLCQKSHQSHKVKGRLIMPRIASISLAAPEKDYLTHRTNRGIPQKDCDPDRINHRKS